jgi:hypothetical protein
MKSWFFGTRSVVTAGNGASKGIHKGRSSHTLAAARWRHGHESGGKIHPTGQDRQKPCDAGQPCTNHGFRKSYVWMEVFTVLPCRLPWPFAGLMLSWVRLDWWRRNEEGSQPAQCVGDPIGECVSLNFDPRAGRSIQKPPAVSTNLAKKHLAHRYPKSEIKIENGK